MSVFCRLDAHMLLKDFAEIARILITAGSSDSVDLLIPLTEHLPRAAQTAVRQIGAERGTAAREQFMQITDAETELIRDLAHGDRFRHMLLHMADGMEQIAPDRLFRRQIEVDTVPLGSADIMQMKAPFLNMLCRKTYGGCKLLIIERL